MSKGATYGLIALLVAAALVGAYSYNQRPARVVTNAVQKLGSAKTQQFEATVSLAASPATQQLLGEPAAVTMKLIGSFDRNGDQRDSLVSDIDITANTDSVTVQLNGQIRFIDEAVYLFVERAPAALAPLAQLKGKWVALPRGQAETTQVVVEGPLFSEVKKEDRGKYRAIATDNALVAVMDNIAQLLGTGLTNDQIAGIRANLQATQQLPVTLHITPVRHNLERVSLALDDQVAYTIDFSDRNRPVDHVAPEGAISLEDAVQ